ncbi:7-carboxy-7-deazaguanine synthase QueE [Brevibacillus sp. 7WMA2]|uniref:7-carboxy-7-deazaguanine synthase QueE n=1 Tax=Brevibacillus sp. 7WMA2 TaxID=2683193 RepID=UPI001575AA19|nr:7-carboxy-7-deazaguanine synthase QueE [Brevibacillus sp. 7WMA2]
MSSIPVLEIFGPTIQGEGMVIGQKTMFVRTAGCDYRCSWCDSAFTWDGSAKEQISMMTAEEIWNQLQELGKDCFSHVTISGGNPLLLAPLGELVQLLHSHNIRIGVETQGSRWQEWLAEVDDVTLSPKPPSSGMTTNIDRLDEIVAKLTDNPLQSTDQQVSMKVVVFDDEDFQYAKELHQRYPQVPFYLQVGNPELADIEGEREDLRDRLLQSLEWLVDKVAMSKEFNNAKVLPQLHTLLWGNKRGV